MRTLSTLNILVSSFVLLSLLLQPSLFEQIRKQVQASNPKLTESLCCWLKWGFSIIRLGVNEENVGGRHSLTPGRIYLIIFSNLLFSEICSVCFESTSKVTQLVDAFRLQFALDFGQWMRLRKVVDPMVQGQTMAATGTDAAERCLCWWLRLDLHLLPENHQLNLLIFRPNLESVWN